MLDVHEDPTGALEFCTKPGVSTDIRRRFTRHVKFLRSLKSPPHVALQVVFHGQGTLDLQSGRANEEQCFQLFIYEPIPLDEHTMARKIATPLINRSLLKYIVFTITSRDIPSHLNDQQYIDFQNFDNS